MEENRRALAVKTISTPVGDYSVTELEYEAVRLWTEERGGSESDSPWRFADFRSLTNARQREYIAKARAAIGGES
jgi:hypothetical protein